MRSVLIILFISILSTEIYAQEKVIIADFNVVNEDTIFQADIPEVEILAFKSSSERKKYFILKRRVLKAVREIPDMRAALETKRTAESC